MSEVKVLEARDTDIFYATSGRTFTKKEMKKYFSKLVTKHNYDILVAHIAHPDLAPLITMFLERDKELYLVFDTEEFELTKVEVNKKASI